MMFYSFGFDDNDDDEFEEILDALRRHHRELKELYSEQNLTMKKVKQWPRHEVGMVQTLEN